MTPPSKFVNCPGALNGKTLRYMGVLPPIQPLKCDYLVGGVMTPPYVALSLYLLSCNGRGAQELFVNRQGA